MSTEGVPVLVLVQHTLADPQDWVSFDLTSKGAGSRRWRDMPKKPVPTGGEVLDNNPGWIFDVNIQGVSLGGYDHYAAEPRADGGVTVTAWQDDPDDWPPGTRWARVVEFLPLAPDDRFGGQRNTRQTSTVFVEDGVPDVLKQPVLWSGGMSQVRPWSEFVSPAPALTAHGIWVSDEQSRRHIAARRRVDWREW